MKRRGHGVWLVIGLAGLALGCSESKTGDPAPTGPPASGAGLEVSPARLSSHGPAGGPFSPAEHALTIRNDSAGTVRYAVTDAVSWLDVSHTRGEGPAGAWRAALRDVRDRKACYAELDETGAAPHPSRGER